MGLLRTRLTCCREHGKVGKKIQDANTLQIKMETESRNRKRRGGASKIGYRPTLVMASP